MADDSQPRGGGRPSFAREQLKKDQKKANSKAPGQENLKKQKPASPHKQDEEIAIYKKLDHVGVIYLTNRPDGDKDYTLFVRLRVQELIASIGLGEIEKLAGYFGKIYSVDPKLIMAIIAVESAGKIDAVSIKGAAGLMQIMPGTQKYLEIADAFDPKQNIEGGVRYFSMLLQKYNSLPLALAAYNAGPGNVDKYAGIPPFAETQKYVELVMRKFNSM